MLLKTETQHTHTHGDIKTRDNLHIFQLFVFPYSFNLLFVFLNLFIFTRSIHKYSQAAALFSPSFIHTSIFSELSVLETIKNTLAAL